MNLHSRIRELKRKHQDLEQKVQEAQRAPGISHLDVSDLKKQKLRIKEEIERLSIDA